MFVRLAQFEGGTPEAMDERVASIKKLLSSGGGVPSGLAGVKRVVLLIDCDGVRFANLVYCETREGLEAADAALNEMNPGEEGGRRTSVAKYEIALDQSMG
jgi:hypothetical protein